MHLNISSNFGGILLGHMPSYTSLCHLITLNIYTPWLQDLTYSSCIVGDSFKCISLPYVVFTSFSIKATYNHFYVTDDICIVLCILWVKNLCVCINKWLHKVFLIYSFPLLNFISIGIIKTALFNMDRENKEQYQVVIQAKDMAGQMGGLSGTTTVNITLTDVNDNPPRFPQSRSIWMMTFFRALL